MLPFLFALAAAIIASTITFQFCKAKLAGTSVPRATHDALMAECHTMRMAEALQRQSAADAQVAKTGLEDECARLSVQLREASAALSAGLARNEHLSDRISAVELALTKAEAGWESSRTECASASARVSTLTAQLEAATVRLKEQQSFVQTVKTEMEREFQLIAQRTVEGSAETLGKQQESKLTDLLKPFREQISGFQEAVGRHFSEEGKEKTALQKEIELLARSSQMLSKQATDLTQALRGSTKQQGDWGEGILERILEHCGLKEGIDYTTQAHNRNEDGKVFRPDVVVHLPADRNLVIDSKVSLNAYWDFCGCEDLQQRDTFLPLLCGALRKHVDDLHVRPYGEVKDTPGYLVMFVPVEAAYITALQHDGGLWQYAYDRNVLLISPTNLIPFMRLVSNLWDRDKKYRNAEEIAKAAGKLYDKLAGVVKNWEKVGNAIRSAQGAYDEGYAQLATGRGNLIARAEHMRGLGISNKAQLPEAILEKAAITGGLLLPDSLPEE